MSPRPAILLLSILGALILPIDPLSGQQVDEPVIDRGVFRVGSGMSFTGWRSILVDGTRVPNAFPLDGASLDAGTIPALAPFEAAIGTAIEDPSYRIGLGTAHAISATGIVTVPISLEYGLTSAITLGARVPFVQRRVESEVGILPGSSGVGLHPDLLAPGLAESFLNALTSSLAGGEEILASICELEPAGERCREGGLLLAEGETLHARLGDLFAASPLLPSGEAPAAAALRDAMERLGEGLVALGASGPALPLPLPAPLDDEGLARVLADPLFGTELAPLHVADLGWALGDIELFGHLRLLERITRAAEDGTPLSSLRGIAGITVRLPTGTPAPEDHPFDPGSGDGILVITPRAILDLARPRWGIRATGSWSFRGESEEVRRISPPGTPLAPSSERASVRRAPGDGWTLSLAPRIGLTRELAIMGGYRITSKGRDRYSRVSPAESRPDLPAGESISDPSILGIGSGGSTQHLELGVLYSIGAARREGRTATRPFDFTFRWERMVAASIERAPASSRIEVGLRVHLGTRPAIPVASTP